MSKAYDFYTLRELKERKKVLEKEIIKLDYEIERRESINDFEGSAWGNIEDLERKIVPRMLLPNKIKREDDIEEERRTRNTNDKIKNLMQSVKNQIQDGIEEAVQKTTPSIPLVKRPIQRQIIEISKQLDQSKNEDSFENEEEEDILQSIFHDNDIVENKIVEEVKKPRKKILLPSS